MTKISSNATFFYKRIFPILVFAFCGAMSVLSLVSGVREKTTWDFLLPLFMALGLWLLFRKSLWDLMDEVHDQGDALLVRNGGKEEPVPLANIMNVSMTKGLNPPRVTLRLVTPCRFGQQVVFTPVGGILWTPPASLPMIDDLMVRVDQARANRG